MQLVFFVAVKQQLGAAGDAISAVATKRLLSGEKRCIIDNLTSKLQLNPVNSSTGKSYIDYVYLVLFKFLYEATGLPVYSSPTCSTSAICFILLQGYESDSNSSSDSQASDRTFIYESDADMSIASNNSSYFSSSSKQYVRTPSGQKQFGDAVMIHFER